MSHNDPITNILTKAVESYGKDLGALMKFELGAFIFSRIFVQLTKKSKQETASLMIILVQGIWRYEARDIFSEKRKCASVLMNRMKRFQAAGVENQASELLFHIRCTEKAGTPEVIELYRNRESMNVDMQDKSFPTEESLARWISSLSSVMAGLAGLVRKEATCMLPMPEPKKESAWSWWKWVFWFLAGSAALGTVGVICS